MMKNISLGLIVPSNTNPRGKEIKGAAFDELVASIKEKGVLMPILVRTIPEGDTYQIVAGHRRFAAAEKAGLKTIPAQILEMSDVEAREAQIVENLQREDIHPLDEGEAYRMLIEKSDPRYDTKEIAAKVGKSESYVRGRLALTNLSEKAGKAYRAGKLSNIQAMLIARIDGEKVQNEALKYAVDYGYDAERLGGWIQEKIFRELNGKPWAKDAKLAEMVGDTSIVPTLFGDKKSGIDPVAYAKQMAAFIEIKTREYAKKGEELVRVSTDYGTPEVKGALARNDYRRIEKGMKPKTIKHAIVVEGNDIGKIFKITTDKEEIKESTGYKQTPEEKAARKIQIEKERKAKEEKDKKVLDAMAKVKMPMSEKHLNVLFDVCFRRFGFSYIQPVAARHGVKAIKVTRGGYSHRDLETPLRDYFEKKGKNGKLQFIFEVGLEAVGGSGDGVDSFIKKL